MADIRVHPAKRRAPWWVWLLALLLAAAVVAFFVLVAEDEGRTNVNPVGAVTAAPPDGLPLARLGSGLGPALLPAASRSAFD